VDHIATSGDPFELGSARPLDFGHWAAHKLEQISKFRITHGEAVAIGIAVDLVYSVKKGILDATTCRAHPDADRGHRLCHLFPASARKRPERKRRHPGGAGGIS
jgi:3-dehydroquinate synthetase